MSRLERPEPGAPVPAIYLGVMPLGFFLFLLASITGIWRIALTRGMALSQIPEWWPPHGHIMLGGFLAALIMFERIIALPVNRLAWIPYAYVISALFLHTESAVARIIHVIALGGWIVHRWKAYRAFHKFEKPLIESVAYVTLSSALIFPGGLSANPTAALTALSFPVVTIMVERLEMSLNFRKTGARFFLWFLILWCAFWILSLWFGSQQLHWMGLMTLLVASGGVRYDMSLYTKGEAPGLQRFLRNALMVAYVWFFLSCLAMIASSRLPGAVMKDVLFHLLGLGFIFTMILAHAPLILPAAFGKVPPASAPVVPFVVFQILTVIRIAGDLLVTKSVPFWIATGWLTGLLHLLSFVAYLILLKRSLLHRNLDLDRNRNRNRNRQ